LQEISSLAKKRPGKRHHFLSQKTAQKVTEKEDGFNDCSECNAFFGKSAIFRVGPVAHPFNLAIEEPVLFSFIPAQWW